MKNILIVISVIIALLIGVVVFLVLNVNSLIKTGIETVGPDVLGVPVTVDDVSISFMGGSGEIQGLRITNPEGYDGQHAITIDNMRVAVDTQSLTTDRVRVREIIIGSPVINYEGSLKSSNIKTLQENAAGEASSEQEAGGDKGQGTAVQIDYFEIKDAKLNVDISVLSKPLNLVMSSLLMEDIGKDERATPAEAATRILATLNRNIVPLIRENASNVKSRLEERGKELEGKANKLEEKVDKVKKLFE